MFWGDFRLSHCYSVSPFISGLCPTIIMEEDEWAPEVRSHQHEHLTTLRWKENRQRVLLAKSRRVQYSALPMGGARSEPIVYRFVCFFFKHHLSESFHHRVFECTHSMS